MAQEYPDSDLDRQGAGGEQEEENRRKREEQAEKLNRELGIDSGNLESFLSGRNTYEGYLADQQSRTNNTPGSDGDERYTNDHIESPSDGGGGTGGGNSIQSWMGQAQPSAPSAPNYTSVFEEQNRLMRESLAAEQARMSELREAERVRAEQIAAEKAASDAKRDSLYDTWLTRSQQSLQLDPNDPIIKGLVDNYRAEQERALRNFRSDSAETGNKLRPTQDRMAAERISQNVGSMQNELLARELSSRRAEVADALQSMGGILTGEQQAGLQRELSNIDSSLQRYQLGISDRSLDLQGSLGFGNLALDTELGRGQLNLGQGQLDLDRLRNELLNRQFYADLGLRAEDQYNYWNDPLRTTTNR